MIANYNIKLSNILYEWQLSMTSFGFCETCLRHMKPFLQEFDFSILAISPFLGGRYHGKKSQLDRLLALVCVPSLSIPHSSIFSISCVYVDVCVCVCVCVRVCGVGVCVCACVRVYMYTCVWYVRETERGSERAYARKREEESTFPSEGFMWVYA